jgi:Ca2+-binding EF-hand superfamily protein
MNSSQVLFSLIPTKVERFNEKDFVNFGDFLHFQAVDHDGSGEITVEEYKLFFKCLGLSEEDAVKSFNAIDTNGDGKLSLEEFVRLGKDFFLSEDDSKPSKHFWGPLAH